MLITHLLKEDRSNKMFNNVFFCIAATLSFLLFVTCEGRSNEGHDDGDAFHLRSRRSTDNIILTEEEKQAVVDVNNGYRRAVGASNMQKLKWNEELAAMAAQWVQNCSMKRGSVDQTEGYWKDFANFGQVMDAADEKPSISAVIDNIVKEQRKMSNNSRCTGSSICLMYDEIFGAVSTDLGCAIGYCQPINPKNKGPQSNKWFTVCYLGPGRGTILANPYQKGIACSKCPGAKWCDEGLCNSDCKNSSGTCECGAQCINCGKVDPESCTCKCPKGFVGDDCSQACADRLGCCKTVLDDGSQSVKDRVCSQKRYQEGCALSCGICEVSHEKNETTCPLDRISPPWKPKTSL